MRKGQNAREMAGKGRLQCLKYELCQKNTLTPKKLRNKAIYIEIPSDTSCVIIM